jgi:hypothetical protein
VDKSATGRSISCRAVISILIFLATTGAFSTEVWASTNAVDTPLADSAVQLAAKFERDVSPRLSLPPEEAQSYSLRMQSALDTAQVYLAIEQFVVLIDRSPSVQAALLFLGSNVDGWALVGATPVSTGLPGRYEHFLTPLGVFDHSTANPDFRAEGTKNKQGFRGYGRKGMRIYDFGWVNSQRGWGKGGMGVLRLQMHATDPDLAEQKLGTAQSEGCVRIPSTLNAFIDVNGLLDEEYERSVARGEHLWVLRKDRSLTSYPGRYMVVVDSGRPERPDWSPQTMKR